jgi:hypothetical protein
VVPLRNLRPSESRAYLGARGVPAAQHPAALSFTYGHPLALSLVADVASAGGDPTGFAPEQRPDVVRALLGRFVQRLPGLRHREALEACAHVRVTLQGLLRSAAQALAAERLGLPFSTYRYQLAGGIRRVTERLWQRELHGDD